MEDAILKLLKKYSIETENCHGQSNDNTINMRGA